MARHDEFELANQRARRKHDRIPRAVSAHFDRGSGRIVIGLSTQMDVAFPPHVVQVLENAKPSQLEPIEITPSGFGLHFPKLDADIYLPALLEGFFGSKRWMAPRLGALGGSSRIRRRLPLPEKTEAWGEGLKRSPQRRTVRPNLRNSIIFQQSESGSLGRGELPQ